MKHPTTLQLVKIYFATRKEGEALIAALERAKAMPVFEGNKQMRAYEFEEIPFGTIEGMAEILKSVPGIEDAFVWHMAGSGSEKSPVRNQGGGFIQQEASVVEYRIRLTTGKKVADLMRPTLADAVTAAFEALGKPVPDAIQTVLNNAA